jgi:N-acetylmuramoyl-L-alanine amidase
LKQTWLWLSLLSALLLSSPAEAAKLQFWRFDASQNQLQFTTDEGIQPSVQLISNPYRLVIDLPGVVWGRSKITQSVGQAIQSVRIAQLNPQTTRIVVELAAGYTINPQQIRVRGASPTNWSVELPVPQFLGQTNGVIGERPQINSVPQRSGFPSGQLNPFPQPSRPAIIQKIVQPPNGNTALSPAAPLPRIPSERRLVVAIDPGHGGPDPGAIGIGGLQEKGVVLDISRQVASLLQQQGVQAILTRPDDRDLDLEPRVSLAVRMRANVFVSIHANAISMSRPDINGLETFYYSRGLSLAKVAHANILQSIMLRDRGVRRASFYVIKRNPIPAILIEAGYLTGAEDAPKLADPGFRSQVAIAIARSILQHLQPYTVSNP